MPVVIDGATAALKDQPGAVINVAPATGRKFDGEVSRLRVCGVAAADLHPTVPEQPPLSLVIRMNTKIAVVNHAQVSLDDGLHRERLPCDEQLDEHACAVRQRGKEHVAS